MADTNTRPKLGNEPWRVRFSALTPELSVQLGLVFIGPAAMIASSVIDRSDVFNNYQEGRDGKEPVYKLYIHGDQGQFPLSDVELMLYRVTYIDWTFARSMEARAVCAPRPIPRHYLSPDVLASVDTNAAAEKAFWGFGRPNVYKPDAKVHQALSGALVDYVPGREPENRKDWVFAPVFIKVQPNNGKSYIVKLYPMWPGKNSVIMMCDLNPADAPQELVDYEFGPRSSERPSVADAGNEGLAALAQNAVRHRR